jgi:uncharacterized protein (DUF362 family)/Pyruvate/2-oxoacid:ferredoxin oxidoreductase delta subunit
MKKLVSVGSCSTYEIEAVAEVLDNCLEQIGGMAKFITPGQRVLLKPNLLSPYPPEKAVTTHPAIVEATVNLIQKAGATAVIADSPGAAIPYREVTVRRIYKNTGMLEVAEKTGAELNWDFSYREEPFPEGKLIKRFEIISPALDADVIISLPKIKTHVLTAYTGAVKNLFGLIHGLFKPGYHVKLHVLEQFSLMLLDLYHLTKPSLTIMDGITGLEGDGPGSGGSPKQIGVLIASPNCLAADYIGGQIIGFKPDEIPLLRTAEKYSLMNADDIEILGPAIGETRVEDFRLPKLTQDRAAVMNLGLIKRIIYPYAKSGLTLRPYSNKKRCTGCKICAESCGQKAISVIDRKARIDDEKCIRCYCCHELCPEAAIELKQSLLAKIFQKL